MLGGCVWVCGERAARKLGVAFTRQLFTQPGEPTEPTRRMNTPPSPATQSQPRNQPHTTHCRRISASAVHTRAHAAGGLARHTTPGVKAGAAGRSRHRPCASVRGEAGSWRGAGGADLGGVTGGRPS